MNKNTFKAQALAIVMVVLVVSSIIGMALFSRMAKDKKLAVEEQNSAAAAETAEGILDVIVGADIETLESNLSQGDIESFANIKDFVGTTLGLEGGASALPDDIEWCEGGDSSTTNDDTYIKLSLEPADIEDYVDVHPGSVMAFNLVGADFTPPLPDPSACNLELRFRAMESQVVFAIKYVYEPGSAQEDTFTGYCALNVGHTSDCTSVFTSPDVEPSNSLSTMAWEATGGYYYLPLIDLKGQHGAGLREIRILPMKGVIGVSNSVNPDPNCINKQFSPIKVVADANCLRSNRAAEMTLPGSGNLGYSTLFDYGIYDNGFFQP